MKNKYILSDNAEFNRYLKSENMQNTNFNKYTNTDFKLPNSFLKFNNDLFLNPKGIISKLGKTYNLKEYNKIENLK